MKGVAAEPRPQGHGRFVTGSTFRHVAVMTLTGALGLTFMFLVDFVTLLYVARLGDPQATAAMGYAFTLQFFTISVGIGFAVSATALVARSLGARDRAAARRQATSALCITVGVLTVTAVLAILAREPLLRLLGAEGETLAIASRFLLFTLPSLPVMTFGMVGSSILRAEGDARRAMQVTLSAGIIAAVLDPFLIFDDVLGLPGLGWEVDGAAAVLLLSRGLTAAFAIRYVVGVHDLAARPEWRAVRRDAGAVFAIALPAAATQLSTPVGNFLLTAAMSRHGDEAVAGWAVVTRMTILAFGGIFALSGAIGGIVSQNWGAGRMDRVRSAYRDALVFAALYVGATWALLWAASDLIARGFALAPGGAAVVREFAEVGAGAFVFAGALFVSNAAFNNLGKPVWSTVCNWGRDAAAIPLALLVFGALGAGAAGVIWAQAAATAAMGVAAALWARAYVARLETAARPAAGWGAAPPIPSGRAAGAADLGGAAGVGDAGLAPEAADR
ncbi:MAG TPA: MATE family efflux transporter [Paracoccaceae bacterium]|nr:MATE family efflux transporter [Paracoccaceae bacterium]